MTKQTSFHLINTHLSATALRYRLDLSARASASSGSAANGYNLRQLLASEWGVAGYEKVWRVWVWKSISSPSR